MVATFSDGKNIYSVDLMLAYINIYKPSYTKINVDDHIDSILNYSGWGDPVKNIFYSPQDVLDNPKKYKNDYNRIMNANINYPIIIAKNNIIVDGIHRLVKAHMLKKKQIKAYVFDNKLLKKFLVDKNKNFNKVDKLTINYFVELFNKRFK